jgi:hypothetical protein
METSALRVYAAVAVPTELWHGVDDLFFDDRQAEREAAEQ